MRLKKVIEAEDAVAVIHDGDVVASAGYGGNGTPDQLFVALEKRFLETGTPRDLTLVFAGGQGDMHDKGLNHLGHAGLLKRVIGGHFGLIPRIEKLAVANQIEAYNLPEGILTHLYRDIGAGKPGTLSPVGLGTYIDPRLGGGRMNAITTEEIVRVLEIDGEEFLFFKSFPIKVALIRGTTADPNGNITAEREALSLENLALAIAARNSGGIVLAQVERIAAEVRFTPAGCRFPGSWWTVSCLPSQNITCRPTARSSVRLSRVSCRCLKRRLGRSISPNASSLLGAPRWSYRQTA